MSTSNRTSYNIHATAINSTIPSDHLHFQIIYQSEPHLYIHLSLSQDCHTILVPKYILDIRPPSTNHYSPSTTHHHQTNPTNIHFHTLHDNHPHLHSHIHTLNSRIPQRQPEKAHEPIRPPSTNHYLPSTTHHHHTHCTIIPFRSLHDNHPHLHFHFRIPLR